MFNSLWKQLMTLPLHGVDPPRRFFVRIHQRLDNSERSSDRRHIETADLPNQEEAIWYREDWLDRMRVAGYEVFIFGDYLAVYCNRLTGEYYEIRIERD